jgi:hypothetical protein
VQARQNKNSKSCNNEVSIFKNWLAPNIENKAMNEITPDLLEQIKETMSEAGKAPKNYSSCSGVN